MENSMKVFFTEIFALYKKNKKFFLINKKLDTIIPIEETLYFMLNQIILNGEMDDKALEAIKIILNSGIVPEVTFIPTKQTYQGIGKVIDILIEMGIKSLNSMPFIPIGRGYDNKEQLKMSVAEKWEFEWLVRKKLYEYPDFSFNNGDPLEHIYLFSQNPDAKTITYEIRCNGDIVVVMMRNCITVLKGLLGKNTN